MPDSQDNYRDLFELAHDVILFMDRYGNILDINRRAAQLTGYSQSELRQMNVFEDLVIAEDGPAIRQMLQDLMAGQPREYQVRWRAKNGSTIYFDGRSTARCASNGEFLSTICLLRDVTRRQQAEEALQRSEDRFRALVEHSLDAILLYSAEGVTLYASPSISRINGYSPQELLGKNRFDWIHPDDLEQARREWSALLQQPGKIVRSQARGRHRDGSWLWIERVFHNLLADPGVRAIVVNLSDITERKQVEEALRASEARYRSVFETAHDVMVLADEYGNILEVNNRAEQVLGYSKSELVHMNAFQHLYVPEDRPLMQGVFDDLIKGRDRAYEVRWRRKDGTTVYFAGSSAPRLSLSGEFLSTVCALRDITERKQAEKALQTYTARLETLHEIDEAILAAHSLEEIARAVLYRVFTLVPCQGAGILLFDFETRQATVYAQHDAGDSPLVSNNPIPFSDSWEITEKLNELRQGQVIIVDDMRTLPRYVNVQTAIEKGIQSSVAVPLLSRGELIGLFVFWNNFAGRFSTENMDVIQELANSLAIAIAQVRLFEQVSAGRDRLRFLTQQLVDAQEVERRRLAQELHDRIGQNLTALSINLDIMSNQLAPDLSTDQTSRLKDSLMLVENTVEIIRDVTAELSSPVLDDYGLDAALRSYIQRYEQRTGIEVELQSNAAAGRLRPEDELALYRIAQEALTNVAKHAQASQVTITQDITDQLFRLVIADNGVGFNPDDRRGSVGGQGLGLLSIRDRAESIGGTLRVESSPGRGTRVIVELKR